MTEDVGARQDVEAHVVLLGHDNGHVEALAERRPAVQLHREDIPVEDLGPSPGQGVEEGEPLRHEGEALAACPARARRHALEPNYNIKERVCAVPDGGRDGVESCGEAGGLTFNGVKSPVHLPRADHRLRVDVRDGKGHEGVAAEGQVAGEGAPGPSARAEPDSDYRAVEGAVVRDRFCQSQGGAPPRLPLRVRCAGRLPLLRREASLRSLSLSRALSSQGV